MIKHTLRIWDCYIDNEIQTTVITDHESLQYLQITWISLKRLTCWVMKFQKYNLLIRYRKETEAIVSDIISRYSDFMKKKSVNVVQITMSLVTLWKCSENEWFTAMMQFLKTDDSLKDRNLEKIIYKIARDFWIRRLEENDILIWKYKNMKTLFLKKSFQKELVWRMHCEFRYLESSELLEILHSWVW